VPDAPDRLVRSHDGTAIAVFSSGAADSGRPPVVLVHGTTADHTAWRALAPLLGRTHRLHAIDRRGRGASGDGPGRYRIGHEFEDVAAVCEAIALEIGGPVDVVGHSYGGRCVLGAALLTTSIRRVVCYEGAPNHLRRGHADGRLVARLEALAAAEAHDEVLDAFLAAVAEMDAAALAAYHANPVWPARVAAARRTLLRELRAEPSVTAGLERLGAVRQPVLLVVGGMTPDWFRRGTARLAARLADARTVVIEGARHAAHHTHAAAFDATVRAFLDA
jgi:pimeloyl-ACP methyl ester carboxylesterase